MIIDADTPDIDLDTDVAAVEPQPAPADADEGALDDIISKALDSHSDEGESDGRSRDDRGRFAPKDKNEAAEAAPDKGPSAEPPGGESTAPKLDPKPDPASEGQFRGWSPEQREAYGKLPPEAQGLVRDVVAKTDSFYQSREGQYRQFAQSVEPLVSAIEPHVDRIIAAKDNPAQYVQRVLNVDYELQFGTYERKVALMNELAKAIGVPLQPAQQDPFADPLSPVGEAYPIVHDLKTQLTQLQQQVNSYQQQARYAGDQQAVSYVDTWSAQQNPDGTPKWPHFDAVRQQMAKLVTDNKVATLDEAYAQAAKPIEAAIERRIGQLRQQTESQNRDAVAKAKRAAPVKSSGMAPGGKTRTADLDALIASNLDAAGFQ